VAVVAVELPVPVLDPSPTRSCVRGLQSRDATTYRTCAGRGRTWRRPERWGGRGSSPLPLL
jgi:hypothetical protein